MNATAWINGNIRTMDDGLPIVSAMLVRGGRIELVGDEREVLAAAGADVPVRDLGGRTVVPGFNDNHLHAVFMGSHELMPDLTGLDERSIVSLLKERYPHPAPGELIQGYKWDYPACPNPRKELLDAAFPDNPVALTQYSGHAHWLNSVALRAVGIERGRGPDLRPGARGQVLREADGEPTGVVRDLGDTSLSRRRYRDAYFNSAIRERYLDIALEAFARLGITSVQDNTWYYPELFSLRARFRRGALSARFSCWSLGRKPVFRRAMDAAFALGSGVPDWIRSGPVKFFVDGTFSTRNAALFEPFLDGGGDGSDPASQAGALEFLARRRRQGAFHIIGDRGIARFLDDFETVAARYPVLKTLRVRIEHAQLVRPEDIRRIADLGICVAAQPTAMASPAKDVAILGAERAERAYPYRSLLDAGVPLSFGSDIPGEAGCDPVRSIHLIANRPGPERISVEEALRCYTVGSAYAEGSEGRKGRLSPGMLADFAVLSQDIAAVEPERVGATAVEETVVGGRTVYRRSES